MALSNSTTRILRTQYYDDYYEPATTDPTLFRGQEDDFHRILFRPRFAVQSRELTQLQTILQAQIEKLGTANFKHGQSLYGAEMAINNGVISGKVLSTANVAAFFNRDLDTATVITNGTANAAVRQYASIDEGNTDNYLVFKYEGSEEFNPGDAITVVGGTENTAFSSDTAGVFNPASVFSITEGVFFISGFLVRIRPQTITLALDTNKPNAVIGLLVNEEVLDELDDIIGDTLLDPANQNAPGAHRFRIRLVLASYGLEVETPANFIQLARVVNGVIQYTKNVSERFVKWSELLEMLARRTYDESGNYMIRKFPPIIDYDPDSESHFRLTVGPGKAYVHGWEVNKTEPTNLQIRKGRETDTVNSQSVALQVGNFIRTVRVAATTPSDFFANTTTVDLHSCPIANIATTNATTYSWSKIGTAKTRMLETDDVPLLIDNLANNSVYKLFFYDVQMANVTGNCGQGGTTTSGMSWAPIAFNTGVPGVESAIVGATIVLSGASSPVRGTFTVNTYSVTNATHANVGIREPLPSAPNGNTVYRILYQTKDIDSFAVYSNGTTIQAPYVNNFAFQADVDPVGAKVGVAPNRFTVVEGTSKNSLLYELGNKWIVANTLSTNTSTFESWVPTNNNATQNPTSGASNTNVSISLIGSTFILPTGSIDADTAQRYLVIYDETGDTVGRGSIVQFSDQTGSGRYISNVSIVKSGAQHDISFTYHHGDTIGGLRTFRAFARATVSGQAVRTKTLITGNTDGIYTSSANAIHQGQVEYTIPNSAPGFGYSLMVPDVINLRLVLYKSDGSATFTSNTDGIDVTSYFTLDTGQRDNTYEYGRAVVKKGASQVIKPTGRLLFVFDWLQPSGRGFSTVDSYVDLTYDEIPNFTSPSTGTVVSLRDVLDFRPERQHNNIIAEANTVFDANTASSRYGNDFGESTYVTSTGDPYLIPSSDDQWIGDYSYYLGRIDIVNLCYDGTFTVNEGQDAVNPQAPKDDTADLALFKLTVPPYTLVDANGVPTSVLLTSFDYKRFTMNDISKVEDRVAHLEYYTALNSLETITRDRSEEDGEGNERFKNGMIVDPFHGGDVGAIDDPNFTASIDGVNRELKTGFRTFSLQFSPDFGYSTTANIAIIGDMATIAYTTEVMIVQNLATTAISVNPFNIASFYGNMKLLPAVDTWKNTTQLPAQVIDMGGPTEAWVRANLPSYTVWGEWEQTWSGRTASNTTREYSTPPGWTPEVHPWRSMTETTYQDTETTTIYQRQGTTFEYTVTNQLQSMGNRVVDTSIVHNVRARDIVFAASGVKPGANMHLFFDGTNVDNYIQKATALQLESVVEPASPPFFVGQTVYVQKALTGTAATVAATSNVTGTGTYYDHELSAGQLLHIVLVNNSFDAYVNNVTSNTTFTLASNATYSFSGATIYTRTPVTIAEVSERVDGANVVYTLMVVRAKRDVDIDQAVPYVVVPGALGVAQSVVDSVGTTVGSTVLVLPNAKLGTTVLSAWAVANSICPSGVVRGWDSVTGALRFDNDCPVLPVNTEIRIVGGPGAGQYTTTANVSGTTNQTALVGSLSNVVVGQSIYSYGPLKSTQFSSPSEVAARAGTTTGVFHMQEAQFAVGNRLVRLCDSANNNPLDIHSSAEAHYEASGITVTQQETIVSSRQIGQRQIGVTDTTSTVVRQREVTGIEYVDPVAETFLVDAKAYPQGVFISSVDLCFSSVPDTDIPITCEIRTTVNGYPSSKDVVPCCAPEGIAAVTLRRDRVKTTQAPDFGNPLSYTRFTFPALVYLAPGREYAIVVRSDSDDYYIWTAEMGALIVGSEDKKVAKQPYAGSFFKSQNASTWSEAPFTDMMFRINKALWSGTDATPQQGRLVTRAVAPEANTTFDSFQFYPHDVQFADVTLAQYVLDLLPYNETTNDATDSVAVRHNGWPNEWQPAAQRMFLQGHSANTGVVNWLVPDWNSTTLGTSNTVDGQIILSTWSPHVAPYVDFKKSNMICIQHRIDELGIQDDGIVINNPGKGYLVQAQSGATSFLTTTAACAVVTGVGTTFQTSQLLSPGDTVIIGGNLECTVLGVNSETQFWATNTIPETRSSNTWFTYGTANSDNQVVITIDGGNGSGALAYAQIGRDGVVNNVVVIARGAGYTETPTLSIPAPSVVSGFSANLQTAAALSYSSEITNHSSALETRYITRSVTLADGFEARDIKVYFDAYRPPTADFYVYYKVLPIDAGETARFEDQPWRLMQMVTDNSVVSLKWTAYKEFQFKTPDNRALGDDDTTDKFRVFAIKVVMASSSDVDVPRIMNFRAIALDS